MVSKKLQIAHIALGGVNEFYQLAQRKFDYDKFIHDKLSPTDMERLTWVGEFIHHLELICDAQAFRGRFLDAIQTRQIISETLEEYKVLLDRIKKEEKENHKKSES